MPHWDRNIRNAPNYIHNSVPSYITSDTKLKMKGSSRKYLNVLNLEDFHPRQYGKMTSANVKSTLSIISLSGVIFASPAYCLCLSVCQLRINRRQQLGTGRVLDAEIVSKPNLLAVCYSSWLIGEDWQLQMGAEMTGSKETRWGLWKLGKMTVMQRAVRNIWDGRDQTGRSRRNKSQKSFKPQVNIKHRKLLKCLSHPGASRQCSYM